jgi:hypothetical protein
MISALIAVKCCCKELLYVGPTFQRATPSGIVIPLTRWRSAYGAAGGSVRAFQLFTSKKPTGVRANAMKLDENFVQILAQCKSLTLPTRCLLKLGVFNTH